MTDLSTQSTPSLIGQVGLHDSSLRREIAWELQRRAVSGDKEAISGLIGLLGDGGEYVDEAASDALRSVGEPAVQPLIATIQDNASPVTAREWAARTLTYLHDPRAVSPMAEIVLDTATDPWLRRTVALYLGRMPGSSSFDALVTVVLDPSEDPELRCQAASALGELGDARAFEPLVSVLGQEDRLFSVPTGPQTPLSGLAEPGTSGATTAGRMGLPFGMYPAKSLHNCVIDAMRELHDPRSLSLFLPLLASEDQARQQSIAAVLGSLGGQAVEPLLQSLQDKDAHRRLGAATALGFTEDSRALVPLARVLLSDESAPVRAAAAFSLGFLHDPAAIEPLVRGLNDADAYVRRDSIHGLRILATDGIVDAGILPTLQRIAHYDEGTIEGSPVVRDLAARVIEEIERSTPSPRPDARRSPPVT